MSPAVIRPLALAAVLVLLTFAAALAAPAGSVVGISGACFVENGGNHTPLALGTAVQIGDTIEVPADGRLKLRMADGSIVSVAAGTRMTVTEYAVDPAGQRQDATLSLGEGLLHMIVQPTRHPAKFEVDTAVGTAAVRSTDWFVETSADGTQVGVLRGSVVVTSGAAGHSVIVPARRATRLLPGHAPLPPRPLSRAEFLRILRRSELPRAAAQPRPAHPEPGSDRQRNKEPPGPIPYHHHIREHPPEGPRWKRRHDRYYRHEEHIPADFDEPRKGAERRDRPRDGDRRAPREKP